MLPPRHRPSAPRESRSGADGLAILGILLGLAPILSWRACATGALDYSGTGGIVWLVSCVVAFFGAGLGGMALARGSKSWANTAKWVGFLSPLVSFVLGMSFGTFSFAHGRALRRRGRGQLPGLGPSSAWVAPVERLEGGPEAAWAWRVNGASETASIAAFSHLANELLALGAPPDLVERAHANAVDEIEHARLCYGIAAAMDQQCIGPDAFPAAASTREQELSMELLATDAAVESCVLEAASALAATALKDRLDVAAPIRAVLATIAVDEARHAEHGWAIFEWCVSVGGPELIFAARAAIERIDPEKLVSPIARDSLEGRGIAGPNLCRRAVRTAIDHAVGRLERCAHERRAAV